MTVDARVRFAVLAAAYALRRFSRDSVSRAAGVKPDEVAAVLAAERRFFLETGGDVQLRDDAAGALEARLDVLYAKAKKRKKGARLSSAILGAEDILLHRALSTNSSSRREELLREARVLIDRHVSAVTDAKETERAAVGGLELVYQLALAEATAADHLTGAVSEFYRLSQQVAPIVRRLLDNQDSTRAALVGLRFLRSPIVSAAYQHQVEPQLLGSRLADGLGRIFSSKKIRTPAQTFGPDAPAPVDLREATDMMEACSTEQLRVKE